VGAAAAGQEPGPSPTPAELPGAHVLVVEDTPINQQVARGMLARLGYAVDVASDGLEALEAVSHHAYAAILMDCQMPRMDGFEATREIRRREGRTSRTPIIAMTASAMRGERDRCLAAGMDDYIAKPVRLQELQARLRRWSGADGPDPSFAWGTSQPRPGAGALVHAEEAGVDPKVLLGLREFRGPGDPDPVVHLVELFLGEAPARLSRMHLALEEADAKALQRAAHALKGSAGTLGAYGVQELCAELEGLAESGRLAGAAQLLQAVQAAVDRAGPALEALRTIEEGAPV
jgi:CheY-like chemotaxis protein